MISLETIFATLFWLNGEHEVEKEFLERGKKDQMV